MVGFAELTEFTPHGLPLPFQLIGIWVAVVVLPADEGLCNGCFASSLCLYSEMLRNGLFFSAAALRLEL